MHDPRISRAEAKPIRPAAWFRAAVVILSFYRPWGFELWARAGIGLEEADFECKNSLILLVIQHFCETIVQDGFTMFC